MREPQIVPSTPSHLTKIDRNLPVAPISLSEHLGVVVHHRTLIVAVAFTVALGGAVYAYSKAPVYEGNLLLSVSDNRMAEPRTLLGSPALAADRKTAMSESEILRSRVILGPVVEKLHLDLKAGPKYMPLVGRAIATWNEGRFSLPFSFNGYSWGNASIKLESFDVPPSLLGATFVVTKISDDQFRLQEKVSGFDQSGQVGTELRAGHAGGVVKLKIDQLSGQTGAQFRLQKIPRVTALEDLRSSLSVSELGKESGMISVGLTEKSPERVRSILNEIGNTYMNFLTKQKDEQSSVSLGALQAQLPGLKKRVEMAEADYEEFRRANRTADLTEETKLKLGRYSATRSQLADLRQKYAEMSTRLGDEHPLLIALNRQIRAAEREGSAVSGEISNFPSVSRELERRSRNLQAETEIYNSVVRKIEEMKVIAQDRSTNVKIVDDAVAPVEPKGSRAAIMAFFAAIGLFLGIFSAFLRKMFDNSRSA
jgi:tyrosine-protein kinase Etk/Wzc